ncbi:MAG: RNA-binding domain-containing protein, partial [Candidatus Desantisbacteria bacterium]
NREYLEELIKNGEGTGLDFKQDDVSPDKVAKTIVAMANRQGGFILLGVDDSGNICGLKKVKLEEWVMNISRDGVKPSIIVGYYEVPIENLKVGVIKVPLGPDKPYYVEEKGHKEKKDEKEGKRHKVYYVRAGSTNREATREELRRLYQASGALHYDECGLLTSSPDDLDYSRLNKYFLDSRQIEIGGLDEEETLHILINTGILSEEDGKRVCTVGGILLFGKEPAYIFPSAEVVFVAFSGKSVTDEILDRKILKGTLSSNVDDICKTVYVNLPVSESIEGFKQKRYWPITEKALREGVVNALVHRDYAISGASVRIFLFTDRLEIRSPGRPPNSVTVEKMKIGIRVHRNPLLVDVMEKLHYVQKAGLGIPMIFSEMRSLNVEPEIRIEEEETILSIPLAKKNG